MSILREYEEIRKEIGEEKAKGLEQYLKFHPEIVLSDIYYNEKNWEDFETWISETPEIIKENEPLFLVVENYKGLCEHNFLGTQEEIQKTLDISERSFLKLFSHMTEKEDDLIRVQNSSPTYYATSNVSYDIRVCQSEEDLIDFMQGAFNDVEMKDKQEDWYFDLDKARFGGNGISILQKYMKESSSVEFLKVCTQNDSIIDIDKFTEKTNAQLTFDHVDGQRVVCVDLCYDNKDSLSICDTVCLLQKPATDENILLGQAVLEQLAETYHIPAFDEAAMAFIHYPVKVELINIGEGLNGDYDPHDPEDMNLLRYDVSVFKDGVWEKKEDSSYCTMFPADAASSQKQKALEILSERFYDALSENIEASVKKIGEEMSWISLESIGTKKQIEKEEHPSLDSLISGAKEKQIDIPEKNGVHHEKEIGESR